MSLCVNCDKKLSFLNETYPLWSETEDKLCSSCRNKLTTYINENNASLSQYSECEVKLKQIGFSTRGLKYARDFCIYNDKCTAKHQEEQEAKEQRINESKKRRARASQSHRIVVTTADLKDDYDIIGPVYFQVSSKGVLGGKLNELITEYHQQISDSRSDGTMTENQDTADFLEHLFLPAFETGLNENKFEIAFYIATEELKKRAAILGADAIVGMRQDIDLDTNGFQHFYLQMYGTAVRIRKT